MRIQNESQTYVAILQCRYPIAVTFQHDFTPAILPRRRLPPLGISQVSEALYTAGTSFSGPAENILQNIAGAVVAFSTPLCGVVRDSVS